MRRIVAYSVAHPLVGNLLMVVLLVLGAVSLSTMHRDTFPEMTLDMLQVKVAYPGASPREVERGVCVKIEEAVRGIAGVDQVRSLAGENYGVVTVSLQRGADADAALRDAEAQVDQIVGLPDGAEPPIVSLMTQQVPVIELIVSGDGELHQIQAVAERLRDQLLAQDEISQIDVLGVPAREISIELSESAMRRHRVSFDMVTAAVRGASLDLSSGSLTGPEEAIRIRTFAKRYRPAELEALTVHADPAGRVIRLGDIAQIGERWEDEPHLLFFGGRPCVSLRVKRTSTEDTLDIVNAVRAFEERVTPDLPAGVELASWADMSKVLKDRIKLLLKNGGIGLALVLLSLTVFLSVRLSFWVAVGIPISFAGTFLVLAGMGDFTINVISLFGLIVVSGILVDDAIVVGENVFTFVERGISPREAAVEATVEVAPAVIASVITTMLAFSPLFFVGGMVGKFIWQVGAVVIIALGMSLVECFFVLPAHLAHSLERDAVRGGPPAKGAARGLAAIGAGIRRAAARVRGALDRGFRWFVDVAYGRAVRMAVRRRWTTLLTALGAVALCVTIMAAGHLKFVFFPLIEADDVAARYVLPAGTTTKRAVATIRRIEGALDQLAAELREEDPEGRDVILRVRSSAGRHSVQNALNATITGSEVVEVAAELLPGEEGRVARPQNIADRWRALVGPIPGAQFIYYGTRMEHTFGKPIQLAFLGENENRAALRTVVDAFKAALGQYPGVHSITDDSPRGKREALLELTPRGHALGLTLGEVSRQLRQGLWGQEVQRLQRGRDEVKVYARYAPEGRSGLGDLAGMRVRTRDGREVALADVARYSTQDGTVWRKRLQYRGVIEVAAEVDESETNAAEVLADLETRVLPELMADHPDITYSKEGQAHEQKKVFGSTAVVVPMVAMLMIIVLVLVFQSFAQGVLILLMIPLGFVGMVLSHLAWGIPLAVLSIMGFIALAGVVINDSVVFLDRINANIREGMDVEEAAVRGGRARFRAILLTTVTTTAGLGPIVFETSLQAQFLIPMALTLAGGLLVGSVFTLVVLPAAFRCLNDLRRAVAWYRTGRWPEGREVEPAAEQRTAIGSDPRDVGASAAAGDAEVGRS